MNAKLGISMVFKHLLNVSKSISTFNDSFVFVVCRIYCNIIVLRSNHNSDAIAVLINLLIQCVQFRLLEVQYQYKTYWYTQLIQFVFNVF